MSLVWLWKKLILVQFSVQQSRPSIQSSNPIYWLGFFLGCLRMRQTQLKSVVLTYIPSVLYSQLTPSLSLMLILAPFSTRDFTVYSWPSLAAKCRGVCWEKNKFSNGNMIQKLTCPYILDYSVPGYQIMKFTKFTVFNSDELLTHPPHTTIRLKIILPQAANFSLKEHNWILHPLSVAWEQTAYN